MMYFYMRLILICMLYTYFIFNLVDLFCIDAILFLCINFTYFMCIGFVYVFNNIFNWLIVVVLCMYLCIIYECMLEIDSSICICVFIVCWFYVFMLVDLIDLVYIACINLLFNYVCYVFIMLCISLCYVCIYVMYVCIACYCFIYF